MLNDPASRRGFGELRFTNIEVNNGELFIDPEKEIKINVSIEVKKDSILSLFFLNVKRTGKTQNLLPTQVFLPIKESLLIAGTTITLDLRIPPHTFRTGLFPLYFWLGQKGELLQRIIRSTLSILYIISIS
jgi:hypothetical protein